MIYAVLANVCPTETEARDALVLGGDQMPEQTGYLGLWRLPEPYGGVVHVFADERDAAQIEAAGFTREDA